MPAASGYAVTSTTGKKASSGPAAISTSRSTGFTSRTASPRIGFTLGEPMNEAQYQVRDGVAVISMNNPPVNGLSDALRAGIMETIEKADQDPAVKAVILIGAAKAFSGG